MNRRDLFATCAAAFGLAGCWRKAYSWNQKLTVTVTTPQGEKSGSAVTRVAWKIGRVPMTSTIRTASVTGEATVVELAPGKYLFALLDQSQSPVEYLAEHVWPVDVVTGESEEDHLGRLYTHVMQAKGPAHVRFDRYPLLVTFGDINVPASVKEVKPGDLAVAFGGGYKLKSITLEITDEEVTEGMMQKLLPWLGKYPEPPLCAPKSGADFSFCATAVHHGDFSRR